MPSIPAALCVHHRAGELRARALTEVRRGEIAEQRRRIDRVVRDLLERGTASGDLVTSDRR